MEPSTQPRRASQAAAVCAPLTAQPADVPTDPALHTTIIDMPTSDGPPPNSSRTQPASPHIQLSATASLPTGDAWTRIPCVPIGYEGRELPGRFLTATAFPSGPPVPARTQPATGVYLADSATGVARAFGLLVITCIGDRISAVTASTTPPLAHPDQRISIRRRNARYSAT